MALKKKGGKKFLEVDFSGVESGGKAVPDGPYTVEVVEVTEEESKDEGNPYLKWKLRITEGDCKGSTLFDNTSLQPQALWKLKGLIESLGEEVPDSVMKIDINDFIDATLDVIVVNENYEGRDRPKVSEYGVAGSLTESSGKKRRGSSKAKDADDDDDDKKPSTKKKTASKNDDDDDDDDAEFEKGQRVKFTDDEDKVQKGKVVSVDDDTVTVQVGDEQWEIPAEDLEAI